MLPFFDFFGNCDTEPRLEHGDCILINSAHILARHQRTAIINNPELCVHLHNSPRECMQNEAHRKGSSSPGCEVRRS